MAPAPRFARNRCEARNGCEKQNDTLMAIWPRAPKKVRDVYFEGGGEVLLPSRYFYGIHMKCGSSPFLRQRRRCCCVIAMPGRLPV